ncbi:aminotransferase class I/II-fold pyridoxal phosphate-dependent enzyme [Algoriphagus halophytocola]|uniref:Aminotransferase class I/II-fold pyridoxal phosphate-dependent enzyme n=1 Tax=Algoriphagus halophytocola TaxID=2991499 RepID=A0ABY6MPI0_9BACT|nr:MULTISPECIES: aminotransferase class I/II-fold pyridoxal phosphate-dependent enzyme [unclassified Algoriphagus]UZD24661.1 aminotransferase class I/II-fold pyridoxal phosphate-dependent enzyme [Algoriphagus sp. TR-M5]WBL42029.1 aminotransferase class I/II-fold pyridoxal phosphate-dependent enzyme [Algoriphagus sp. TR-M9]
MKLETLAIHGGNIVSDKEKPVIQPITLSTTFVHQPESMIYARANNPNRHALEQLLAGLEKGADAAAFSSGNAAGVSVFQALDPGSHLIAPDDMYHGLKNAIETIFKGILEATFVDMTDLDAVEQAFQPNTKLVWVETPSNPLLKITDIRAVAKLAKAKGAILACDNTFATPVFQNPIAQGADIVMHSSTKYFGGHSDIMGGALITKVQDEFWEKVKNVQIGGGAVPTPMDCYYLCRSIKTLPYRMKGHAEHAMVLANFLDGHQAVEKVYYPGLKAHPGHDIAAAQMTGFGGIVSFLVKSGADAADVVISKLRYFTNATSLGGVESLIERRAASEGPDTLTPQNLIRVSVGLEHLDDLLEDLERALAAS